MTLRSIVKSLLPSIVSDTYRGGLLFPDWKSAQERASGYGQLDINAFRVERAKGRKVDGSLLLSNPLLQTAKDIGKSDLAVTDFGGSTGELGLDFLRAFPDALYIVVENPKLVSLMMENGPIRFTSQTPKSCDIFFSSGTIQYIEHPMAAVEAAFVSARHAVIFCRNSFSDRLLVRVQRSNLFRCGAGPIPAGFNDRPLSLPHQTVKESGIHEAAAEHGFRCISRTEEADGVLAYRDKVYGKDLVFLKT